ncbi:MAG: branched-chain amino acid ABC transporter permease [Deltaproteobacteria bacterium]|nr:branched-chain amino acid ABC transporter permease [Deltaproteobacteria bacterium]MBW2065860.1 branched-chain amino acid ABC transporter permease [Deltaproteobacteria bacterium]
MLQTVLYGLLNGFHYSIIALGIALVFGVMRYLNIAHGSLIILGAYGGLFLFYLGIDPFLSIPFLMAGLFILGAILYKLLYSGFVHLGEGLRIQKSLLVSFGLMLVIDNGATILWTSDERSITPTYTGLSFELLRGLRLPLIGVAGSLLALALILALHLFFSRTYFGKSVVAVSQDPEAASLMGINVARTFLVSFGLSVALAAIPSVLIGLQAFSPGVGIEWFNKGIIVVMLAGLGNIYGVFPAGILLGVLESVSVFFFGAPYREITGLAVFVLVLILFPKGLFGRVIE